VLDEVKLLVKSLTSFRSVIVTGGAGFIGSHIVDKLIDLNVADEVVVIDNFSSGRIENLSQHLGSRRVKIVKDDLRFWGEWVAYFRGADAVIHMAANPEVRLSSVEPRTHFDENVLATFNVLEASRLNDVQIHVFASSSTVYGDAKIIPTPEDHPLNPISVYGASKAACELLYTSYSNLYGFRVAIARYANIIGKRSNHGVIVDFIAKLRSNPHQLEILGDGTQRKSYLHVSDAVDATMILLNYASASKGAHAFNVGNEDWVDVKTIADIVVEEMGLSGVEYRFKLGTPDGRGWPGDVKFMLLDISKIKLLGWRPRMSSKEAVRRTVREHLGKI